MDKRGVSPLVATILLILLSVGMGVAVMSWGEEYIEEKAEFVQGVQETPTSCDMVSFNIIKIGGADQLCLEGSTIKGLIDNGPDANIAGIHARIVAEGGIGVIENILDRPLQRGSAAQVAFSAGGTGPVSQIKLTPSVTIAGKTVICSKQAVIAENIRNC
ncbi:MAG: hypothetical protein QXM31_00130 [Candidatus Woesearchaeota archaeon]